MCVRAQFKLKSQSSTKLCPPSSYDPLVIVGGLDLAAALGGHRDPTPCQLHHRVRVHQPIPEPGVQSTQIVIIIVRQCIHRLDTFIVFKEGTTPTSQLLEPEDEILNKANPTPDSGQWIRFTGRPTPVSCQWTLCTGWPTPVSGQ